MHQQTPWPLSSSAASIASHHRMPPAVQVLEYSTKELMKE